MIYDFLALKLWVAIDIRSTGLFEITGHLCM